MRLLSAVQLANRIKSIVHGQRAADSLNACIATVANIFETCGNLELQLAVINTFYGLVLKMHHMFIKNGSLNLGVEQENTLIYLAENGPVRQDLVPDQAAKEFLLSSRLATVIASSLDYNHVALTVMGVQYYLQKFQAQNIAEAKAKRGA